MENIIYRSALINRLRYSNILVIDSTDLQTGFNLDTIGGMLPDLSQEKVTLGLLRSTPTPGGDSFTSLYELYSQRSSTTGPLNRNMIVFLDNELPITAGGTSLFDISTSVVVGYSEIPTIIDPGVALHEFINLTITILPSEEVALSDIIVIQDVDDKMFPSKYLSNSPDGIINNEAINNSLFVTSNPEYSKTTYFSQVPGGVIYKDEYQRKPSFSIIISNTDINASEVIIQQHNVFKNNLGNPVDVLRLDSDALSSITYIDNEDAQPLGYISQEARTSESFLGKNISESSTSSELNIVKVDKSKGFTLITNYAELLIFIKDSNPYVEFIVSKDSYIQESIASNSIDPNIIFSNLTMETDKSLRELSNLTGSYITTTNRGIMFGQDIQRSSPIMSDIQGGDNFLLNSSYSRILNHVSNSFNIDFYSKHYVLNVHTSGIFVFTEYEKGTSVVSRKFAVDLNFNHIELDLLSSYILSPEGYFICKSINGEIVGFVNSLQKPIVLNKIKDLLLIIPTLRVVEVLTRFISIGAGSPPSNILTQENPVMSRALSLNKIILFKDHLTILGDTF